MMLNKKVDLVDSSDVYVSAENKEDYWQNVEQKTHSTSNTH